MDKLALVLVAVSLSFALSGCGNKKATEACAKAKVTKSKACESCCKLNGATGHAFTGKRCRCL